MRVRFGRCILDTASRELVRDGHPVRLTGKAFRLLEVLIENHPRALSKDDLQDRVWPGIFVSEANLTRLITDVRRAIGDDGGDSTCVRTVYGFGYAFSGEIEPAVAPVRPPKRSGRYRLVWGRREIPLADGENVLGRGIDSIEVIDRETVSRRHARVFVDGDLVTVEDLGSKNGTFLRGARLLERVPLQDGDEIMLGSVRLTFRAARVTASTTTAFKGRR